MRLTAIEAVRYGALEGECLSGLSEGLTVVLGPNESGKSTMTALTRHVLYGYPDGRSKERGYEPLAGSRAARLLFADATGEWAIERLDGKNRGSVSVAARRGAERPELLGELVSGVSEQSYRVVFGFGLDELALIERGDSAEIVSRLYAAGFGLAVNPMDARKRLETRAGELYSPRASKPAVNAFAAQMRDLKLEIAALESQAAEYADEQARLAELAEQIEPLRNRRDELDARLHVLEQDAGRLGAASDELDELAQQARDADAAIVAPRARSRWSTSTSVCSLPRRSSRQCSRTSRASGSASKRWPPPRRPPPRPNGARRRDRCPRTRRTASRTVLRSKDGATVSPVCARRLRPPKMLLGTLKHAR